MGIYTPRQAPLSGISPPWGAQTRTQHTGAEQRGRITPPDLLWMHCLMQPRKSLSLFFRSKDAWPAPAPFVSPPGHPQDLPCRDFFPFFSPSRRCCAYFVLGCAGRGATRDGAASPGSARDAHSPPLPPRSAKQRGERGTRRGGTAGVQLLVFSSFSVCSWQERRVNSPVQSALHLK